MEDKYLSVDIGKITVSVKMNDEGISLDVIKKHDPIGFAPIEEEVVESASKTYSEFGLEVKKIED
jgi:DNA-directed RNA polymerase subunit E'/Rpb7|tara:strand:- start:499 stop:693 length:195 start_codon:yes stop_codon:yes gene_type:complete